MLQRFPGSGESVARMQSGASAIAPDFIRATKAVPPQDVIPSNASDLASPDSPRVDRSLAALGMTT